MCLGYFPCRAVLEWLCDDGIGIVVVHDEYVFVTEGRLDGELAREVGVYFVGGGGDSANEDVCTLVRIGILLPGSWYLRRFFACGLQILPLLIQVAFDRLD